MSEPLTIEWLREKWTDPENERPDARVPLLLGDWVAGTPGGQVMMMIGADSVDATGIRRLTGWGYASEVLDPEWAGSATTDDLRAWAGDPPPPPEVTLEKCPECSGSGRVRCECECGAVHHENECEECEGRGKVESVASVPTAFGYLVGRLVNRAYVAMVLEEVPGTDVRIAAPRREVAPVVLDGEGWRALVMPVLDVGGRDILPCFPPQEASDAA